MNINIDMPMVEKCNIEDCSYNADNICHAKAITIGDGESPLCDTLFCGSKTIPVTSLQAGVGACKVSACSFNNDLECSAESISIGLQDDNAGCMTYTTH